MSWGAAVSSCNYKCLREPPTKGPGAWHVGITQPPPLTPQAAYVRYSLLRPGGISMRPGLQRMAFRPQKHTQQKPRLPSTPGPLLSLHTGLPRAPRPAAPLGQEPPPAAHPRAGDAEREAPPPALLPGPLPSHGRSFCHRKGREVQGLSNAQSRPWISLVGCCGWAGRLEWDGVWALALGERDGGLGGRGPGGAGPTWARPPSRPSAFL